jgi:Domain of unknown function (DUF4265)
MKQVAFTVVADDGWGLTGSEHLWCEEIDGLFELRSVPLGVKGLAVADRFCAEADPVNGCVLEHELVEQSGHSLVLVRDTRNIGFDASRDYLESLGCRSETLTQCRLLALDIPADVGRAEINTAISQLKRAGFEVLPRVWRHGVGAE